MLGSAEVVARPQNAPFTKSAQALRRQGFALSQPCYLLACSTPDLLYEMVVEVDEQVALPLGETPST